VLVGQTTYGKPYGFQPRTECGTSFNPVAFETLNALGEGRFVARPVRAGIEAGERVEIVAGLEPGEQVVTSAQFLLDSESSVRASLQRLTASPAPVESASSHAGHTGHADPVKPAGHAEHGHD